MQIFDLSQVFLVYCTYVLYALSYFYTTCFVIDYTIAKWDYFQLISLYFPFVIPFAVVYVLFKKRECFERLEVQNTQRTVPNNRRNRNEEEEIGSELSDENHICEYARSEAFCKIFTPSIDQKLKNTQKQGCVICLADTVEPTDRTYLPCMHYFHKDCIHSWFCTRHSCPVCRKPVRIT